MCLGTSNEPRRSRCILQRLLSWGECCVRWCLCEGSLRGRMERLGSGEGLLFTGGVWGGVTIRFYFSVSNGHESFLPIVSPFRCHLFRLQLQPTLPSQRDPFFWIPKASPVFNRALRRGILLLGRMAGRTWREGRVCSGGRDSYCCRRGVRNRRYCVEWMWGVLTRGKAQKGNFEIAYWTFLFAHVQKLYIKL